MSEWIDFKELRQRIAFADVLKHYSVEIRFKGPQQHHGYCPLPNHNGKRRSPSFSANLAKGIFQCFGCGAKGNLLDFAVLMERLNPDSTTDVHGVAVKLHERFLGPVTNTAPRESASPKAPSVPTPPKVADSADTRTRVINAPLDFELKHLDAGHPYLAGRRLTPETIAYFGLGFCSRGYHAGRIAIPLHDPGGQLIGYAGRLVNEDDIGEDSPKYRFPPKREREGVLYEFQKTQFVYHGHRIAKPVDELVVVEGFPSVWWLWQNHLPNAVALMGSSCDARQAERIIDLVVPSGRIWILPDADPAGARCADSLLHQLAPHRFVRWLKLREGQQPTDLGETELRSVFRP